MEPDTIIVGAGSAGCVLADRLSAQGDRVLVLEAGGSDARFWIKAPLGYAVTFADPTLTWRYFAEPDAGLNHRALYWPRGRVVGGSSSINAMAYVRGLPHDFDDWARAGAAGWDWSAARRTFERLERHHERDADGAPWVRGDGPLAVSNLRAGMHPFSARFLDAAAELGWPTTLDMNGAAPEGLTYFRSTVLHGLRFSAADAFLRRGIRRGGVVLRTHALAERIVIEDGRAVGVRYRIGDRVETVRARREVIVSAGAVNAPQLLQLSGLGPAALLRAHGIAVVRDLPEVGRGLQDHLVLTQSYAATRRTLNTRLGRWLGRLSAGLHYVATRGGPIAVPVNQVGGFVRSSPAAPTPDLQFYCNPIAYAPRADGRPRVGGAPGFSLSAQPCRPTSRGEVRIVSADVRDAPSIRQNALSTDADRAAAARAGAALRAFAEAPTLRRATRGAIGPDLRGMDDAALLETFRERAVSNYHASCTCRMGDGPDTSVVDARLRVHGVPGLRVVDASAFPNVTSGNTNAPTLMLALRAADLISEDAARR